MRKLHFLIICFIAVSCFKTAAFCSSDEIIKIGLTSKFNNIPYMNILNNTLYFGIIKNDIFYGSDVISGNDFSAAPGMNYYISSKDSYSSFESAEKNCPENGMPALIDENCWKIYYGGYSSEEDAVSSKSNFQAGAEVVKSKENSIVLYDGNNPCVISDSEDYPCGVKDGGGGAVSAEGNEYRGCIAFIRNGKNFNVVNILSIDEYLYGVVPCEMPCEWHEEALKAQAVVARCFALYSKDGKHSNDGYDICDSTHCQVYKGVSAETEKTNSAVDETSNKAAYYDGKIIEANYFSSSGGSTADAADVWGFEIPYLKAVLDYSEKEPKVWIRAFSLSEITKIAADNGENIGNAVKVYIGSQDKYGRVNSLIIEGDRGNITLEREKIRTFFSCSSEGSLLSRNFSTDSSFLVSGNAGVNTKIYILGGESENYTEISAIKTLDDEERSFDFSEIEKITIIGFNMIKEYDKREKGNVSSSEDNKTTAEDVSGDVVFYGKGMGHGVGMSQMGAKALAENGMSYTDILKYYYTGIEIDTINP